MTIKSLLGASVVGLAMWAAILLPLLSACGGTDEPGIPAPTTTSAPNVAPAAKPDVQEGAAEEACQRFVEEEITPVDPVTYDGVTAAHLGVGVYRVSGAALTGGDQVLFTCVTLQSGDSWMLSSLDIV